MKKFINSTLLLSALLPAISYASTGDTTFNDIYTQLSGYLTGSLGLLFVILGFIGAVAAVAGFASMKVMFPVFGLALSLHYGPTILEKVFGASGDYNAYQLHHMQKFSLDSLLVILLATVIFTLGYSKYKNKKAV